MIIVSQDKKNLINFDNVTQIFIVIDKENENQKPYLVRYESVGDYYETLGNYATEERAKEVLRELIEKIKNKSTVEMDAIGVKTEISDGIYEMPQE